MNALEIGPKSIAFWQRYLTTTPNPVEAERRFYEVYRIGDTAEDADLGARLISEGKKTTTSSLLWEYEVTGKPPPTEGVLSLVEDGQGEPVAIVETTWLAAIPLNQVKDRDFIVDYAEWGETAENWQAHAWAYYARHACSLGREPSPDMPLLCERFRVVYP
jgi:uncharacterized protein YhfF